MTGQRLITKYFPAVYADCFSKSISSNGEADVDRFFDFMFCDYPWVVKAMLKMRDALVKPFGLRGGASFRDRIIERNDEEIVVGSVDKHLSFWVSLYCSPLADGRQTLSVTTVVKHHNLLGKIYFAVIWLFHKMIVGGLFRKACRKMSRQ